jgi:hypothetical protein
VVLARVDAILPLIICERRHGSYSIGVLAVDREQILLVAILLVPEDMPMRRACGLVLRCGHHAFLLSIRFHLFLAKIAYYISVAVANSGVEARHALPRARRDVFYQRASEVRQ